MPNNPWIWVLAIVVGAVVLVIALRRGGKVKAGVGATSLQFEARVRSPRTPTSRCSTRQGRGVRPSAT